MTTMRILILADSHHDYDCLVPVLKKLAGKVDGVFHLGDGVEDLREAALRCRVTIPRLETVRGNGDADPELPYRRIVELEGRRALLVHGQYEDVYSGPGRVVEAARAAGAELALFAHTHRPFYEEYKGVLVVNPGSISRPRGRARPTFAILEVPSDASKWYDVRFYEVVPDSGRILAIDAP